MICNYFYFNTSWIVFQANEDEKVRFIKTNITVNGKVTLQSERNLGLKSDYGGRGGKSSRNKENA